MNSDNQEEEIDYYYQMALQHDYRPRLPITAEPQLPRLDDSPAWSTTTVQMLAAEWNGWILKVFEYPFKSVQTG